MFTYKARLEIIGVNPFVPVPEEILSKIFSSAGKDKVHIPVCGTVNGKEYRQTLLKYSGEWRLYINAKMLDRSPKRIGEEISISIELDPESREIKTPGILVNALKANPTAKAVFDGLPPSRRLEIVRYLSNLKTEESLNKNVTRAINFLLGKDRFVGRDKP